MYKIIAFLLLINVSFADIYISADNKNSSIIFKNFLIENFSLESENIFLKEGLINSDINFILLENKNSEKNNYSKVLYKNKEYIFDNENIPKLSIDGLIIAKFISPWSETPFIIEKNKTIYINNINSIKNTELKKILIEYLSIYSPIFKQINKTNIIVKNNQKDITNITNGIIIFLVIGISFFISFLAISIKRKFGNSFKGE